MKPLLILAAAGALVAGTTVAPTPATPPLPAPTTQDAPYDGRFTFVRVQFGGGSSGLRDFGGMGRGRGGAMWAHDYPRADRNFLQILKETTLIHLDPAGRVLRMDDPEIFNYPAIYVVEVGYWDASDEEIEALSQYLAKGGFLIVDDFRGWQIQRIQDILARAIPSAQLAVVPDDHEIFDSFFRIEDPASLTSYGYEPPTYVGLFEDGDPKGRMMAMLNYNGDIAEYWEYSDIGYLPIDLTNEAYKFGVNYVVYAMTH